MAALGFEAVRIGCKAYSPHQMLCCLSLVYPWASRWPNVMNTTQLERELMLCLLSISLSLRITFLYWRTAISLNLQGHWETFMTVCMDPLSYYPPPFCRGWEPGIIGSNAMLSWKFWRWEWEWRCILSPPGWNGNTHNFKATGVPFSATWTREVRYVNLTRERRLTQSKGWEKR